MKALFETTRMFPENWISPSDIGAFYRGMMDAVFANNAVTAALGDAVLLTAVAGVLAIPATWLILRRKKG